MPKTEIKKDEFLLKIIHDLKNPTIAQIKALESFLLTACDKISQEERELIQLTLNSCNYMQNLIEIFSSVHKLDYEPLKLNYEKFGLIELIGRELDEMNILLKYHELNIDFKKHKEIILNADKIQLKRVVETLLLISINNAFKNTTIILETRIQKNNVIVEIKNQSPYIEPKILKEIFEKNKTHASSYNKAGVGLGLYLSKEIVHAHFGKMILKSSEDNVNIFGFELPLT